MKNKGLVSVVICYVIWGILPIYWKLLSAVDSFYVLACRVVWSFLFIAVVLAVRHDFGAVKALAKQPKELARLIAAGVAICTNWGSYIWAVSHGHVMDASLAYYMSPIITILLGALVFRERLTRMQWMSLAIAVTGIVISVVRYGQMPWLALLVGGSFSLYGAIKKGVTVSSDVSLFYETLAITPLFVGLMIWMEVQGTGTVGVLHGWQFVLPAGAGLVTVFPMLLFTEGLKTTPLNLVGILLYINPTLQLLLSVWLYHETFTVTNAILFAFVWTGLALYLLSGWWEQRRQNREEHPCV